MSRRLLAGGVAVVCAAVLVSSQVLSQEETAQPSQEDMQKMMQEWMKLGAPGENHKHLDQFTGEWKTTMRMYPAGPQSEPMEETGHASVKWILGGRFLHEEFEGKMMGMPFQGMSIVGYDNIRNLYNSFWVDNMGTQMYVGKGTRTPDGVMTFYGEMDEPTLGTYGRVVKFVHKMEGKDKHVMTCYDLAAGDNHVAFEIVYERE